MLQRQLFLLGGVLWVGAFLAMIVRQAIFNLYWPNLPYELLHAMFVFACSGLIFGTLSLALGLLFFWLFPRYRKHGLCRCGYDLTGNTSGTCPECGADIMRLR